MRRTLVVVAILVVGLDAQSPAPAGTPGPVQPGVPPRDGRGGQTGTAVIRGSVVDAESGQPIRRASVIFSARGTPPPVVAVTDASGNFELASLPAGAFSLQAQHDAFYGAGEPLQTARLGDGQVVEGVVLSMRRLSAIAGRIVDENGDPAIGVQVRAIQRADEHGRPTSSGGRGSFSATDDTGAFRAWGLRPGRYLISAVPGQGSRGRLAEPSSSRDGHAPTYYPGSVDAATRT